MSKTNPWPSQGVQRLDDMPAREWVESRPPEIRDLMRRFPPGATVRATRALAVPGRGKTGVVVSYFEGGLIGVLGEVSLHGVTDWVKAECRPEWLEVVDVHNTSPEVLAVLGLCECGKAPLGKTHTCTSMPTLDTEDMHPTEEE